ncbi:MAG: substrate-binding domain-containing protein [Verrucomicrobia bacterium]|nr:substrate-binding domain-containing protein [Verrucomicrobiota bacterium]MCH8511917.1 substrate-binding domain-containing protein [Kiritimatiellia bacterium]
MAHQKAEKSIYIQSFPDSAHGRRIIESLSTFAHGQTPSWRVSWGIEIPLNDLHRDVYTGIIFSKPLRSLSEQIKAIGIPAVQVGTSDVIGEFPAVLPDHHAIGEMAVGHYRERLFRNFAFVGNFSHPYSQQRLRGVREVLTPSETFHGFDLAHPRNAVGQDLGEWLQSLPRHTGMLAASDPTALELCNLCEELGLRIPGERAVLGVDNDNLVCLTSPVPFSSIDPASEEVGLRAGEMLRDLMDGKPHRKQVLWIPPVGVVLRASTDHLATDDDKVAAAARMMREEACAGLKVEEICRRVGLGRRMFELRFHRELGRTPEAEMRNIRMERARFLLMTTNKSVQEIAEDSGFQDSYYFSAAFKKANGLSPRNWRERQRHQLSIGGFRPKSQALTSFVAFGS